jgi:hypothetical protein
MMDVASVAPEEPSRLLLVLWGGRWWLSLDVSLRKAQETNFQNLLILNMEWRRINWLGISYRSKYIGDEWRAEVEMGRAEMVRKW